MTMPTAEMVRLNKEYTLNDCGIVRGHTNHVHEGNEYSNIRLIRLDAPRQCMEFAEWVVRRPKAGVASR